MLKLKFENLLLILIVLSAAYLATRYLKQSTALSETSQSAPTTKAQNQPSQPISPIPSPNKKDTVTTSPPASNGGTPPSKMVKYKELLKDPTAGLERLSLLEQMKSELSQDEMNERLYYEVINNGPTKEASADENHERRNIVSAAFRQYTESCQNFDDCYKFVVAGLARYADQELFDDLYKQVQVKYPQDWQRDKIVAEMKKYGLVTGTKKK
jgi:hypothetical protein